MSSLYATANGRATNANKRVCFSHCTGGAAWAGGSLDGPFCFSIVGKRHVDHGTDSTALAGSPPPPAPASICGPEMGNPAEPKYPAAALLFRQLPKTACTKLGPVSLRGGRHTSHSVPLQIRPTPFVVTRQERRSHMLDHTVAAGAETPNPSPGIPLFQLL